LALGNEATTEILEEERLMNRRGLAETAILVYVIIGLIAFFVPNPISTAVGLGNRQNKIVQTDKVTLINDKDGVPIAYRTVSSNSDTQQKITFWEWLASLPVFVLFLMGMGIIFPPIAMIFAKLRSVWKNAFKNQYHGLSLLPDQTVICRKCGDTVTIDTKEFVFDKVEKKMDKRDKVLEEKVRTELVK